jgi:hypothetical protein
MLASSDATGFRGNSVSVSADSTADNQTRPFLRSCRFRRPQERVKVERPQAEPVAERP